MNMNKSMPIITLSILLLLSTSIFAEPAEWEGGEQAEEIVEMEFYLQELENFRIELMTIETLQQFNEIIRDWNIRLDSTREEFDSQFGETMGEYKGYCPRTHLYIGIGYGTLASQTWLAKKSFLEGGKPKIKMIQSNMEVEEYINTARHHLKTCIKGNKPEK